MNPAPHLQIPRAKYGLCIALAIASGLICTWFAAGYFGGSSDVTRSAMLAVAIGSILSFGPALFRVDASHWGITVLLCGVVRGLAVLGIAYLMAGNDPTLTPRPLFLSAASGAILILVAESTFAIMILSQLERRREELKSAGSAFVPQTADQA